MRAKELDSILVTTSAGELLGVFYGMPHAAPLQHRPNDQRF